MSDKAVYEWDGGSIREVDPELIGTDADYGGYTFSSAYKQDPYEMAQNGIKVLVPELARLAERNKELEAVVELAPKCICSENEDGVAVVNFSNTHTHRCKVYRKALMKAGGTR
jgi:hypothetical protein